MISLENQIDFSKQKLQSPQYEVFLKQAIKEISKQDADTINKFKKPRFDEQMQNHLIVTNIPDVTGKQQKFLVVFKSLLQKKKIGESQGLQSCDFGYKEEADKKKCNQTMYLIYKTPQNAKKAYQKLHMLKFSKQHTLSCFTVKQFRLVQKLPQVYTEPKLFLSKQLRQYNLNQFSKDHFLYRLSGSDSQRLYVKYFDHVEKSAQDAIKNQENQNYVDLRQKIKNVTCSTRGSYVAVCVSDGIRILGGPNLEQKAFLPHKGVSDVQFSPQEKYMVSFTGTGNQSKSYESIMLWAVEQEVCLYSIRAGSHHDLSSIQFNNNDTKVAICGQNQVYIHDCSSFKALKQSLKLSQDQLTESGCLLKALHIKKVIWMPDNTNILFICYELNPPANSNSTSKMYFYNIETKEERKWRAIGQHIKKVEVTISDWNQWVAVSFKKIQKKAHGSSSVFIVNLTKRQIQTEALDFKQSVVSISWDKKHSKFGVVYAINTGVKSVHTQYGVHFYQIQKRNNNIQEAVKICEIEKTPLNQLIMAQNGIYFALYNISPQSSGRDKYTLGYLGKDPKNKKTVVQFIKEDSEVSYLSYFFMDQSGRFITLGTDKMFQIWNMAGQLILKNNQTLDIKNVQFRPRYIKQISVAQEKIIADKEKQLKKKYGEIDEQRTSALLNEKQRAKQQQREQFKNYLAAKRQWYNQYRQKVAQIRGFDEQDPSVKSASYSYPELKRN